MFNARPLTETMHCSACGQEDPILDEGYTTCCNKPACCGEYTARYGTETDNVTACCWGKAFAMFNAAGRPVPDDACALP